VGIQYSTDVNNAKLDQVEVIIGPAPVLELWSGTKPANCAASDTGTKLANGALPSDWMNAAASASKTKLGTWTLTGLAGAGGGTTATYFRITVSGVCKMQGSVTITAGGGDMTMDNPNIANAQVITDNTFTINAGNT
jgi:hypothetical protein